MATKLLVAREIRCAECHGTGIAYLGPACRSRSCACRGRECGDATEPCSLCFGGIVPCSLCGLRPSELMEPDRFSYCRECAHVLADETFATYVKFGQKSVPKTAEILHENAEVTLARLERYVRDYR